MSFVPNPLFEEEFSHEASVIAGMLVKAEEAATLAKAFAPINESDYRDSIGAIIFAGDAYLQASDFKAWWIEYGTGQPFPTPIFAPLRRAVVGIGMTLHEEHR